MKLFDLDLLLSEKWSQKYKRSIDCSNPKGFSQRAHCQGRKKNESWDTYNYQSAADSNQIPTKMINQGFTVTFDPATRQVTISKGGQVYSEFVFKGTQTYSNYQKYVNRAIEYIEGRHFKNEAVTPVTPAVPATNVPRTRTQLEPGSDQQDPRAPPAAVIKLSPRARELMKTIKEAIQPGPDMSINDLLYTAAAQAMKDAFREGIDLDYEDAIRLASKIYGLPYTSEYADLQRLRAQLQAVDQQLDNLRTAKKNQRDRRYQYLTHQTTPDEAQRTDQWMNQYANVMKNKMTLRKEDVERESITDLDRVLVKLCEMVVEGQERDPDRFGMVAACIIDPDGRRVYGINVPDKDGLRRHAERVAIDRYVTEHGDVPNGSTCVTTCSPCTEDMEDRHGENCADLLKTYNIKKVYCGYNDPSQEDREHYAYTQNPRIRELCAEFAATFLKKTDLNESADITNRFIKRFLPWLQNELGLKQLPEIRLVDKLDVPSFGEWNDADKTLTLATAGRHPVDVLRTMAHELTHYRQNLEGRLNPESGETGSDEENEANAEAGVVLRKFNNEHPEYITDTVQENFAGKRAGETITQGDVLRLQGQIRRLKDGTSAQRERGIRLERQLRTFLNTHKKPNYAMGVNEDQHPNDVPPGPETKPTMPKGTVRVDVSDVYDWYKLGQHIPNMDRVDKKVFGKGPPSTIFSFGDEELEHEFIDALKKTGLTTTDIDPVDPDQPPGTPKQKTDPTFNVDEAGKRKKKKKTRTGFYTGYPWSGSYVDGSGDTGGGDGGGMAENFADGKVKGKSRPGRVKRAGASCKGSVTDLRARAKAASGEKAKMYHWCANMKSGRKK